MARFDLGLSDEEFGDLSYAQFEALIDRKKRADRLWWIHTGTLATAIINFSERAPERRVKVTDFLADEESEVDISKLSAEEQATHFMNLFAKQTITRH